MFNPLWVHFVEHLYTVLMDSTWTPPIDSFHLIKSQVHFQSTPHVLPVDSMRTPWGVEWSGGHWRRTGGGVMWSPGGLHGLHMDWRWTPQGSVGECKIQPHPDFWPQLPESLTLQAQTNVSCSQIVIIVEINFWTSQSTIAWLIQKNDRNLQKSEPGPWRHLTTITIRGTLWSDFTDCAPLANWCFSTSASVPVPAVYHTILSVPNLALENAMACCI